MTTPANPVDLATWLRATLDAREREVRERHRQTCGHDEVGPDWPCNCDDHVSFSLAEVDAKRRILDEVVGEATGLDMQVDNEFRVGMRDEAAEPYLGDVLLRLLALPFAGWPGYRSEWAEA